MKWCSDSGLWLKPCSVIPARLAAQFFLVAVSCRHWVEVKDSGTGESCVCVSVNRNRDVCVTHLIFKSSSSGIDPLCEHDSDLTQNHDSVFIRSSVILIIIQLIHYDYVSSVKWNKPRRFSGFPARLWLQELPPVPPAPPAPRPPWETRLLGPGWLVVVGRKF